MVKMMDFPPKTSRKTPFNVIFYRVLFLIYFLVAGGVLLKYDIPEEKLVTIWVIYLGFVYAGAEGIYYMFKQRKINLVSAFPLLIGAYTVKLITLIAGGQTKFSLMNRLEHFITYLLLSYIVWVFFMKYLSHKTWKEHPFYTSILVFAVVSAAGVFNELIELFMDTVFHTNAIGPGFDTVYDLLMNTIGILLFLGIRLAYGVSEESDGEVL